MPVEPGQVGGGERDRELAATRREQREQVERPLAGRRGLDPVVRAEARAQIVRESPCEVLLVHDKHDGPLIVNCHRGFLAKSARPRGLSSAVLEGLRPYGRGTPYPAVTWRACR